jgi:hypothetical protein
MKKGKYAQQKRKELKKKAEECACSIQVAQTQNCKPCFRNIPLGGNTGMG